MGIFKFWGRKAPKRQTDEQPQAEAVRNELNVLVNAIYRYYRIANDARLDHETKSVLLRLAKAIEQKSEHDTAIKGIIDVMTSEPQYVADIRQLLDSYKDLEVL